MEKCSCWEESKRIVGWYKDQPIEKTKQVCNGTKEREECSCDGNESKCNFYPEKRKENKSMNTAEMWIKAQEDGCCYEAINYNDRQEAVLYQKDKGFFDEDGFGIDIQTWAYLDDLMSEQWRLRTMTKSEAETKFNIKIVGD